MPIYDQILKSSIDPDVTISYKQPDAGTCQTAFEQQKQYTGYIKLPPATLAPIQQNYDINTFFWFVEARQSPETAPLTIWLNGGPGSSSMVGMFTEMGPCQVVQASDGTYGTQARIWGWDRSSNVLFIDQPNQVGFSFDTMVNGSYDFLTDEIYEPPDRPFFTPPAFLYQNGTFSTADNEDGVIRTANTTDIAARAVWHFLQTWLATFPQYNPAVRSNSPSPSQLSPVGINLFAESYGGKYGPTFANYFEEQNSRRANGSLPRDGTLEIQLENLGIVNGLIDDAVQYPYYANFANNNTYGIQAIDNADYINTLQVLSGPGGCLDRISRCRAAVEATDTEGYGDDDDTNTVCERAEYACAAVYSPYVRAGYSVYDVRQKTPSPDPPSAYMEYLNTASVLQAIGAPVNYTETSYYVFSAFISTGDSIRGGQIQDLADLLRRGVRVALIYGDADYICNWYGGEAVSLALAAELTDFPAGGPKPYASGFPDAGYAEIVTNSTYVGGAVRQYGNLSFSRIYDSGHLVPYYQPETAFTVFTRIIQGNDIATGKVVDLSTYESSGPVNATHTNEAPSTMASPTCWIRSWNATCSQQDLTAVLSGMGVVRNGIFYRDEGAVVPPQSSVSAGSPGKPIYSNSGSPTADRTSSLGLTGVYTATSTPSHSHGHPMGPPAAEWIYPFATIVSAMTLGILVIL